MSNKPNPVALTAAMLMERACCPVTVDTGIGSWDEHTHNISIQGIAALASDLHRLAPAVARIAVGCCNHGYWGNAQSLVLGDEMSAGYVPDAQTLQCVAYIKRIDKKLAKLNARLEPLALVAKDGGDPRGWTLRLHSTDKSRPVPRNGWDSGAWGIG